MEDSISPENLIYLARLAEQAERYEDMAEHLKKVIQLGDGLSEDGRNLLSVAYKNVIGSRRASMRVLTCLVAEKSEHYKHSDVLLTYRKSIEDELNRLCSEVIECLDQWLIPSAESPESKVFYHKMKADYYRYLAEFLQEDERKKASDKSLDAYKAALEIANELPPVHPTKLGLALNLSVFYYEIVCDNDLACSTAGLAFDEAANELKNDPSNGDNFKDSTLIMQLLRDNLSLWSSQNEEETE